LHGHSAALRRTGLGRVRASAPADTEQAIDLPDESLDMRVEAC
jgi:hypothetical protein